MYGHNASTDTPSAAVLAPGAAYGMLSDRLIALLHDVVEPGAFGTVRELLAETLDAAIELGYTEALRQVAARAATV